MRAATGGVHLLMSDHVARTHRPAIMAAAETHPNAAQRRRRQAAAILGEAEVGWRASGSVVGPQPQVFIDAIRRHDFAGIHPVVAVPDRLELAKRLYQLWPEDFRQ